MRMTRTEIEAWYDDQKLPKTKKGIVYRAFENDGRLIIGIYEDHEKKGIYILHKDGRRATKRATVSQWGTEGICPLLGRPWYWGAGLFASKDKWDDKDSKAIGEEFIEKVSNEIGAYNYLDRGKISYSIEKIDESYNAEQSKKRESNKQRRIEISSMYYQIFPTTLINGVVKRYSPVSIICLAKQSAKNITALLAERRTRAKDSRTDRRLYAKPPAKK